MQTGSLQQDFHLTYCTNIHPGNGWNEVYANLQQYAPLLKRQISPRAPFGLGLRLSDQESRTLVQEDVLESFRQFLEQQGLYVFTLNGFPYGPFHRQPVKAQVHAPDWRREERVAYTLRLIEILAALLPEGIEGSISTSPLSYKAWVDAGDAYLWGALVRAIVRVAAQLIIIKWTQGKVIHLDIEPEPGGLLENSREVVQFYKQWLLEEGVRLLAKQLSITQSFAYSCMLEHIRICLDTCHAAVAYEAPADMLKRFDQVGIQVGKVQLSSALRIVLPTVPSERAEIAQALVPFVESTYLHQVVQQNLDGTLTPYSDLPEALPHIQDTQISEWRIHFHVPIFIEHYAHFHSTQSTLKETLALIQQKRSCTHLEIETYTWDVLPDPLKKDVVSSITREYVWALNHMVSIPSVV